jgi:hypothetical protein
MPNFINGWTPPIVYDLATDTRRIATQADVDSMQEQLRVLGGFYTNTRREIEAAIQVLGPKPKGCLHCGKGVGQ